MSDKPSPEQPPEPFEYRAWVHEQRTGEAERAHDASREFRTQVNEAAIRGADAALRTAILINGGAAVALLAFVGSLEKHDQVMVAGTLIWFAWGVAFAALGMAFAYLTHFCLATSEAAREWYWEHPYVRDTRLSRNWGRARVVFHSLGLVAGITSLAFFIYGMSEVRDAILLVAEL